MNSRTTPNLIRSCPLFTVHLGCDLLASVVACILWLWITSAQPMCAGTIEGAGPWHYGWTHGLEKISRDRSERLFHSQPGATLRVELAGNEYEGVQLVLRSAKPLRNVAVRVSDLTTDNGGRLGSEPVEVLPVGYVNTRKRGNKVWWYVCTGSGHPYANFFIEYTAVEHRLLMGFMPHKFRSEGFLYWCTNSWASTCRVRSETGKIIWQTTPYREPIDRGPLTNADGNSYGNFNGDGQLFFFYPGPDGPVPTIRLQCIRDGLEDYEYLWLLRQAMERSQAGHTSRSWRERVEAALSVAPDVVESLTRYTRDGAAVLAARHQIARLLTETGP